MYYGNGSGRGHAARKFVREVSMKIMIENGKGRNNVMRFRAIRQQEEKYWDEKP